ncbi:MAG: alpha/beta hydrolase [Polyangiaceae bacterium]|nr:alpha/beta hydrolase [Polyangiaceae bacterium]
MNIEKRTRGGVTLAYIDVGEGDPPMVFVHGATCDHTYFQFQIARFRKNHRVVALDLRGHGASDVPANGYTPDDYASDVAWLCGELGIHRPIIVGHSMGGIVALALAAAFPDLPAAIAMLDSPIFVPSSYEDALPWLVEAIQSDMGMQVWRTLLTSSFHRLDDRDRRAQILEATSATPHHVLAASFTSGAAWDAAAAARACKVAALYVRSATFIDLDKFRSLCPTLSTGETVGAGHFAMLEVPDQIDAMLERFTRALEPPASAR